MLKFLTALGFLGLIGIVILIIIYIIKPNYQQKTISSTHVWKLSLKYKRKRIPISKLRNLLIFICQLLIIAIGTFILAQPYLSVEAVETYPEKIVIIDASASMLAVQKDGTRFEKAIADVKELGNQTFANGGLITVILADQKAEYVEGLVRTDSANFFNSALSTISCTYGVADIDGAMLLAEKVLDINPAAEVFLFTATKYSNVGKVKLMNVDSGSNDWNVAILNVEAKINEENNYFEFLVKLASYNSPANLEVNITVHNVNADDGTPNKKATAQQSFASFNNNPLVITFNEFNEGIKIYSYSFVSVEINAADSFVYDNAFYLYGGTKEDIKVLYVSSFPDGHPWAGVAGHNNYITGSLRTLRTMLSASWNITIKETTLERMEMNKEELRGYDFYIFEHKMPYELPLDGVVLLINPNIAPDKSGISLDRKIYGGSDGDDYVLSAGEIHPIMASIDASVITVSEYIRVSYYEDYQTLMYCGSDPALLIKNENEQKIAVIPFSLHYSNFSMLLEWPIFMFNLFNYYFPPTITQYVYEIDEAIALNARASVLNIIGPSLNESYETLPCQISAQVPGIYTLTQLLMSGNIAVDNFFVRIAEQQSDFSRVEESLTNPFFPALPPSKDLDLLIFLASAMVTLLFFLWLLYARNQF